MRAYERRKNRARSIAIYQAAALGERGFEVICDETNNTPEDVAQGVVRVTVKLPMRTLLFEARPPWWERCLRWAMRRFGRTL